MPFKNLRLTLPKKIDIGLTQLGFVRFMFQWNGAGPSGANRTDDGIFPRSFELDDVDSYGGKHQKQSQIDAKQE